jgi:ABC-2 type transport system ATP-binding protein
MKVIEVKALAKTYRTPLRRKRVEAVRGISFAVEQGEVFGFLGPNGAGKTTTIRMLMGLMAPSAGEARIFDHPIPSREARAQLGFLPEAPYFYDFLTVAELLDFTGRLFGIDSAKRRRRADELIALVGLERARDNPLKSYSKGMLQRAGIAQALINDPDLLVFDEPMGGLDPVGRKEVRDIILELRDRGKTVFFSSHILADVESVVDRVAILARGEVVDTGTLGELVDATTRHTDVNLKVSGDGVEERLADLAGSVRRRGDELMARIPADGDVDGFLAAALEAGASVTSVTPHHETLEEVFIRSAGDPGEPREADRDR